jgi:hypothetical protein
VPSLWQECCPLIVMEACSRAIPCVSSNVFGLAEANTNPRLLAHAALSYDHARGTLHHGVSNAQLEQRLGAHPSLPSNAERAAAVAVATLEEATVEEVLPFEALLRPLLEDEATLRRESLSSRDAFLAFAGVREGGLERELSAVAARRPPMPARPSDCHDDGHDDSHEDGHGALRWCSAAEEAARRGVRVRSIGFADIQQPMHAKGAITDELTVTDDEAAGGAQHGAIGRAHGHDPAADDGAHDGAIHVLASRAIYRVVHKPFVFLRAAPATDAAVHNVVQAGSIIEVDAVRDGWVRTAAPFPQLEGGPSKQAWALLDGRALGLGTLLESSPS